ncbi:MAG: cysteine--tRNA ligase [bacterium]|nr:cysteine--tRNA ligase [bacterium]
MLKISNTLTKEVEDFKPIIEGEVKMYHCGPTVYDYAHIGNLRAFLTADILRRYFEHENYKVTQVMNITDVGQLSGDTDEGEDKMTIGLRREGKQVSMESMKELADFYTERFKEDILSLNILLPHHMPKASEHIEEDIEIIKILEDKGFTYKTTDGVYFSVAKDPHYGLLGGTGDVLNSEARINTNTEKEDPRDFALWKFNKNLGFPSPWGQGFPGWHIECSAMSRKYLGESFDIHTGGIDLAPIHHNNEIAQSENACGCKFVNYWVHNEFLQLSENKMAKSAGNSITIRTIIKDGYSPLSYRYFLLLSHYKTPTNFTFEGLGAAETALKRLKDFFDTLPEGGKLNNKYHKKFLKALDSDLNTPEGLGITWQLVKDPKVSLEDKRETLLNFDKILGLHLLNNEFTVINIPSNIRKLLEERDLARIQGEWQKSDEIRESILKLGYEVMDTDEGPKLNKI